MFIRPAGPQTQVRQSLGIVRNSESCTKSQRWFWWVLVGPGITFFTSFLNSWDAGGSKRSQNPSLTPACSSSSPADAGDHRTESEDKGGQGGVWSGRKAGPTLAMRPRRVWQIETQNRSTEPCLALLRVSTWCPA